MARIAGEYARWMKTVGLISGAIHIFEGSLIAYDQVRINIGAGNRFALRE